MERLDKINSRYQEMIKTSRGFFGDMDVIDLFQEPGFVQMTYMQRRARMIEATLDHMGIRIFPDELLCGSPLETWVDVNFTTYEERRAYCNLSHEYDKRNKRCVSGKQIYYSRAHGLTDEELLNPDTASWNWGHICGGFKRILDMGYEGIAQDAESRIQEMVDSGNIDVSKKEFWEAVITTTRAVCRLSERYADEAQRLAAEETDPVRAKELSMISTNMRRVPAYPAKTFWEALQSMLFVFVSCVKFNGIDIGRLDQYLYPYYVADVEKGILTKEQAEELIGNFFLKCYEYYVGQPVNVGRNPSIMLAGLNADGRDGTNDITYMCMRATERFYLPCPKISIRVNEQTPMETYEIAHRMLLKGINHPDFYADRVIIPAYERMGIPFEDAVEYAQSICEEVSLAGISEDCTNEGVHVDVHDKVRLAMKRVAEGAVADTFEDFMCLVEDEIRKCIRDEKEFCNLQTEKLAHFLPQPLHSAGIVGCLESGKDILAGGAKYNNTGSCIGGLATSADGLYAIKKLVYEEKRMSLVEFYEILEKEYEGHEMLRAEILNKMPKFGNDDDRVDSIAVRLFDVYAEELEKGKNNRGGCYKVGAWASGHRSWHNATPDGRKQGDTFATNISPTPGRDMKGVTAVIHSGTKINQRICTAGSMLDIAMSPSCIRGENGVNILKHIVTTYGLMGGSGLQFNIVDGEVLKKAKENPADYQNLMVRVWGYNDYFVSLPEDRQEHIISRTIHSGL